MVNHTNRDLLRNELINETIARATEESTFYQDLYSNSGVNVDDIQTIADLWKLPIVNKDQLRIAGSKALSGGGKQNVLHIQNTSGSTGEPYFIYRSAEEHRFIREFFLELNSTDIKNKTVVPIMLQFLIPQHGIPTSIPGNVFVLQSAITNDNLIDHALLLLRKEFTIPNVEKRVSILSGDHTGILSLTNYLLEHGIDCNSEFRVRLIQMTGRYLTSRWRKVLKDAWGAVVIDRYSMSEIFGGASFCPICEGYHFDPHVVPELVDFNGKNTLIKGTGILLLTSLYPFVQLQPMIRYMTEDVFHLDPDTCYSPRFEFRGRLSHALFNPDNSNQLLLTGKDVIEAIDGFPEINRTTHFRDVTNIRYGQAVGFPIVQGLQKKLNNLYRFTLKIELVATPSLFPDHIQNLKRKIFKKLLKRSEHLCNLISSKQAELNIEFVKPQTLGSLQKVTKMWEEET